MGRKKSRALAETGSISLVCFAVRFDAMATVPDSDRTILSGTFFKMDGYSKLFRKSERGLFLLKNTWICQ